MNILFLSTHNLATNPRLVKEINLALENGFTVSVLCFEFDNWSKEINESIKKQFRNKINYRALKAGRNPLWPWLQSSIIHECSKILLRLFPNNIRLLAWSINKRSWLLLKALKKDKEMPALIVAHNVGSFYPVQWFAKKNQIAFGVDLEDYHPGETNNKQLAQRVISLQHAILPQAEYISAASLQILEYAQRDVAFKLKNTGVVLNYFSSEEFAAPENKQDRPIKLVWFSQHISFGRGLEQLLPVIKKYPQLQLHLFGNCNHLFREKWLMGADNIFIHAAISQQELHKKLATFDIGLAIEPGKDLNNELALSNKILAYYQAGLYILASATIAQKAFLAERPHHGLVSGLEVEHIETVINQIIAGSTDIRTAAAGRYIAAKQYGWEETSKTVLKLWKNVVV